MYMIFYQRRTKKKEDFYYYEWIRQDCVDEFLKKDILASITYYFCTGKSVSKEMENIKERIADFTAFKEELGRNEIICNNIQTSI